MKITDQKKVIEVIGRLLGRATSYMNAGNQTSKKDKKETCFKVVEEFRNFAILLSEAFDEPNKVLIMQQHYNQNFEI